MKFAYFPGCTLKNKAKDLDTYARKSAAKLGVELCEVDDFQCCGGVYGTGTNDVATKLSSVRALKASTQLGLVTVCSACHNVIKQTNEEIKANPAFAAKINRYMSQDKDYSGDYNGETEVLHFLELLRDKVGFDKIKEAVVNPLKDKKIGAYYGCLLLRPSKVMAFDDPENPTIIEEFIKALGATPIVYAKRNECCGGYVVLEDKEAAKKNSLGVIENAKAQGADMIVTACPLCRYNLQKCGGELPVVYITELLAEALGVKED